MNTIEAMMTERPILFSGPMVRAILDGRKTQTRRVMTPPGWCETGPHIDQWGRPFWLSSSHPHYAETWPKTNSAGPGDPGQYISRYGQPGDLLYVRETWRAWMEGWTSGVEYRAGGPGLEMTAEKADALGRMKRLDLRFPGARADCHTSNWRPSVHMPKWAVRLWLRVVDVRAERVYDISEEGCWVEGLERAKNPDGLAPMARCPPIRGEPQMAVPRGAFAILWNSINAKRPGCAWSDNPWVWVVGFERTEAP